MILDAYLLYTLNLNIIESGLYGQHKIVIIETVTKIVHIFLIALIFFNIYRGALKNGI